MAVKKEAPSRETGARPAPAREGLPWAAVAALLILFFPAGITLMLAKLHREKANFAANGRRVAAVGWVFAGIGALYCALGLAGGLEIAPGSNVLGGMILMFALFCGGGWALVRHGKKYRALGLAGTLKCPHCGGANTPPARGAAVCEFCGWPLEP